MAWYDVFSRSYDRSLEKLYADARATAAQELALAPGLTVLDVPCGTGQSFEVLAPAVVPGGRILGVDLSAGMLRQAAARIERRAWDHVHTHRGDVHDLGAIDLPATVERLHVFLGLSTFPRWEEAFARLWARLAPGGRCVVVDVHAERPGFQGHLVNLIARADIRRRFWQPLAAAAEGFELVELPRKRSYGGALLLASGRKPA